MIGIGPGIGVSRPRGLDRAIRAMFSQGEKGIWYDPRDFSTLFQDNAGTTPVTAVGQAVGKILDKSGNGYHATQATGPARPILGRHPITGRRNLLTYTEDFGNAAWLLTSATITANSEIAPDGTTTADLLNFSAVGGLVRQITTTVPIVGNTYTNSVWLKAGSATTVNIRILFSVGGLGDTGVTVNLTNEWQRFSVNNTVPAGTPDFVRFRLLATEVGTIYAWGGQSEKSASPTAYQKVVSTYDVTEAGVNDAYYLKFDGVDDFLVTPSIDFSATDEVSVFAGVRKLSDAARGYVLSCTGGGVNGFEMQAPNTALGNNITFESAGTIMRIANYSIAAPATLVLTATGKVSTDTNIFRANGTQVAQSAADQGTGNYSNAVLTIGNRSPADGVRFNGHLYSLIVRGALSDANQISAAESFVNSRTGAY